MEKKIQFALGTGERYDVQLHYSHEGDPPLETGGGIFHALPLLGDEPFIVVNGDIWTDYSYADLSGDLQAMAHLVLVDNPEHNPQGDFSLQDGFVRDQGNARKTFSGIGVYHPDLFRHCDAGRFPLAPLLQSAMSEDAVTGELYTGQWLDIGTQQRLTALNTQLSKGN